jgi:hypothetical protein
LTSEDYLYRRALIERLEVQRDLALKDAENAPQSQHGYLNRYADAMQKQIDNVKNLR